MSHVIRSLVFLAACFLILPSLAQAEDALVSPEAARDVKAVSQDAAQKVKVEATKVPAATRKVAPATKKAVEGAGKRLEKLDVKPQGKK